MIAWSEVHIGIVYYAGLAISGAAAAIVWRLLAGRPAALGAPAADSNTARLWGRMLSITIFLAALLGAVTVKFYSCSVTEYEDLLSSSSETIWRGLQQVSVALLFLGYILVGWLLALAVLVVLTPRRGNTPSHRGSSVQL